MIVVFIYFQHFNLNLKEIALTNSPSDIIIAVPACFNSIHLDLKYIISC